MKKLLLAVVGLSLQINAQVIFEDNFSGSTLSTNWIASGGTTGSSYSVDNSLTLTTSTVEYGKSWVQSKAISGFVGHSSYTATVAVNSMVDAGSGQPVSLYAYIVGDDATAADRVGVTPYFDSPTVLGFALIDGGNKVNDTKLYAIAKVSLNDVEPSYIQIASLGSNIGTFSFSISNPGGLNSSSTLTVSDGSTSISTDLGMQYNSLFNSSDINFYLTACGRPVSGLEHEAVFGSIDIVSTPEPTTYGLIFGSLVLYVLMAKLKRFSRV